MATIRERRRSDGTRAVRGAVARPGDRSARRSLTYDDDSDATVAKQLIEATGGHAARGGPDRRRNPARRPVRRRGHLRAHRPADLGRAGHPQHYRPQLRRHISPTLGSYPVAALTYRHVAGWVREMSEKGPVAQDDRERPRTVLRRRCRRRSGSGTARTTRASACQLPKSQLTHDEMTVLTRDEFALLLSKVSPFYQPLVITLVATGLRWGEATALTVGDLDLIATPADAARHEGVEARCAIGTGTSGRRRPTGAANRLATGRPRRRARARWWLARRRGRLWCSPTPSGRSCRRRASGRTTWTPALDAATRPLLADGTPDLDAPRLTKRPRVHDLRHTHASWMIAAGTDLFVLQRRLGHESITTTTETVRAPAARPAGGGRGRGGEDALGLRLTAATVGDRAGSIDMIDHRSLVVTPVLGPALPRTCSGDRKRSR